MQEQVVRYNSDIPLFVSGGELPPRPNGFVGLLSEMHLHKEYEMLYLESGKFKCVTLDNEFLVEKGDIIFINTYIPHSTYSESTDSADILLQFNMPSVSDSAFHYVARFLKTADTPVRLFKGGTEPAEELKKCILSIVNEHNNRTQYWKDFVYANILMIMVILRRNGVLSDYKYPEKSEMERIVPTLEYINESYAEPISTAELSKISNFNESYFCRMFKTILGTTPTEYLNFVRICKAEHLLKKGLSVSDAAYQTGFASLSYFNRIFKKYNYCTPSEYKKISKKQEFDYSSENLFK